MKTIEVVLDTKLLRATARAARRTKLNRSELIREAIREYLKHLEIRTMEERDRAGYSKNPHSHDESRTWEAEAAWPAE